MKTIYFKNGMQIDVVSEKIVEVIRDCLQASSFEFHTFQDSEGKVLLIINIKEIVYIR